MGDFQFKPFSLNQRKILNWWTPGSPVCRYNGIIADGAIRSGKTLCMSLSFVMWAMESFESQNFAMCGKTVGSFRRNVLAQLKSMLPGRGYRVNDRRVDNLIEIRRGRRINYFYIFGGKDERSQDLIQGITLAGVLFDEVALMPESFVNQATGRCSIEGSKFWFNCNPDSPHHWFKTGWIDERKRRKLLYLQFSMADNSSLAPEIRQRYESQYYGVFYERYILGRWKVAEGLVYPMFDAARHVVDDIPEGGRWYVSIDYGTMNPTSMGLWSMYGNYAVRASEYYYDGRKTHKLKTDEEYYSALETLTGELPIQYIIVDPSAASFIATIRRHNRFAVRSADNSVLDGIRVTGGMLDAEMIKIHRSCKDTIREFGLYRWDEKATEDRVIKADDHAMDDLRYFCNSIMRRENRRGNWTR